MRFHLLASLLLVPFTACLVGLPSADGGATGGSAGGGVTGGGAATGGGGAGATGGGAGATDGGVQCGALTITGDAASAQGAAWSYASTDDGVSYALNGRLYFPADAGSSPSPAVVISHGKGGMPGQPATTAQTMRGWGLVVIAPRYTHAASDDGGLPAGGEGASEANVLRAKKAVQLLSCLPVAVDLTRVAAHGHSKGAFLTGGLVSAAPELFRAASHTAGGVTEQGDGPTSAEAANITVPYQLHHSTADCVVLHRYDEALRDVLADAGTPHELYSYFYDGGVPGCPMGSVQSAGIEHAAMQTDPVMYGRVRDWYLQWGVLP